MYSKCERHRILLSRLAAAVALIFLCITNSTWEVKSAMVGDALLSVGIALVGIASLGRMWCSLFIAGYKDERLVTAGPYSVCRNPLYFFSLIGVIGIGFCTQTFTFPLISILTFAVYYPLVIKSEEARLMQQFTIEFERYKQAVPAFFPKISLFTEPKRYTVNAAVFRKHAHSALWFIWIAGILMLIVGFKHIGWLKPLWSVY